MILSLYQKVDILFSILEELLNSPFNKQFDDKVKHILHKHGLDVVEGEIVKTQRRVSAEAKELCYGMCEDKNKKELIRINKEQLDVINAYSHGIKFPKGTTHIPSECFFDVMRSIWRHYNYSIDIEDTADIDSLGIDMDKMIGEYIFRKTSN